MATIETRKNSDASISYRVKIRIKGYPSQTATFDRKTDAKEWASKTERSIKDGLYFKTSESKKHTLSQMVERYLGELKRHSPKRYEDAKHLLEWWGNELGCFLLSDISKARIIEKRELLLNSAGRNNKPRSPSTVNRYMTALSHSFTIAVNQWEWLHEHPMKKINKLPEPKGRIRFLDDIEREALLKACKHSDKLYLLVVLALSTGARHGEIINLQWKNVDFKRKVIVLHETKNGEIRVLPLVNHAYELMKQYSRIRNIASQRVFPSSKDPNKTWSSRTAFQTALKTAQIEDFRFHDLRHSAASYLAMNGASLAEIAEVLGHKTLQMVKRYAHLSEAHTAGVVERMNNKIFG